MTALWGGRFEGALDGFFARFQRSLPFDRRLLAADVQGSIAWAVALARAGILKATEVKKIHRGLRQIEKAVAAEPELIDNSDAEDIHSFVEAQLQERVGNLARKLHTGRSRNDQVATDLKLFLRAQVDAMIAGTTTAMAALVELAGRHPATPLPGYTHLQRAQPITIGHHALAYVEMLARDRGRLTDARARMDTCPLGAAALAGTTFGVDRRAIAKDLGFAGPARNSLDAVGDRDHVCEVVFACAMIGVHLSRLAEDWIFFASHEAGFLEFDDAVATGSSLMPQKKNPDAMELLRGKSGRIIGALATLLTVLKGLPLAYNKDLQEDKEALFDALDTTRGCLTVTATAAASAHFREPRCAEAARGGYLNATDLADLLVARGVPFRDAHERTGRAVREAMGLGVELEHLPRPRQRALFPEIGGNLQRDLAVPKVLARRRAIGGTAPSRVRAEIATWKKRLTSWQK